MKRLFPLLLALLILLSSCTLTEEIFTDKRTINPIPEGTTALIFAPVGESTETRIIRDAAIIEALRSAYRWTNYHLHCCLEGEVQAYMTIVVNGSRKSSEPDRVYADLSVPSYNIEFRRLLYAAWENAEAE